jgi:hypothetical protein
MRPLRTLLPHNSKLVCVLSTDIIQRIHSTVQRSSFDGFYSYLFHVLSIRLKAIVCIFVSQVIKQSPLPLWVLFTTV